MRRGACLSLLALPPSGLALSLGRESKLVAGHSTFSTVWRWYGLCVAAVCVAVRPWAGTVAAYTRWLSPETQQEFAMGGLTNSRTLQVLCMSSACGDSYALHTHILSILPPVTPLVCVCFVCSPGRLQFMWTLQLKQVVVVAFAPACFALALYEANVHAVMRWPR